MKNPKLHGRNPGGSKDLRDLVDEVSALPGWRVEATGKGGWKVFSPDPSVTPCSINHGPKTRGRSLRNAKAKLRRMGAKV